MNILQDIEIKSYHEKAKKGEKGNRHADTGTQMQGTQF